MMIESRNGENGNECVKLAIKYSCAVEYAGLGEIKNGRIEKFDSKFM